MDNLIPLKRLPLTKFLTTSKHFNQDPQVLVLGNTSADLDSIVSSIVYAYFSSRSHDGSLQSQNRRLYTPLINLPKVPSGKEIQRLRPEFCTALWLSCRFGSSKRTWDRGSEEEAALLQSCITTTADLSQHYKGISGTLSQEPRDVSAVLVDWNAMPSDQREATGPKIKKKQVSGFVEAVSGVANAPIIRPVGCIDHHVDEGFIREDLSTAEPRIIQTGVGSCSSLVVRHLRESGLWSEKPRPPALLEEERQEDTADAASPNLSESDTSAIYEAQVAGLALSAILIDTANLTAEGKVSDIDRESVAFLESKINKAFAVQGSSESFNRTAFFEQVQAAKTNALHLLTIQEILDRDYKEWTESLPIDSSNSQKEIKIGISSAVKPLSWIMAKAAAAAVAEESKRTNTNTNTNPTDLPITNFFAHLQSFAESKNLNIVAVMTAFTNEEDQDSQFQRELLIWSVDSGCDNAVRSFLVKASEELKLADWEGGWGKDFQAERGFWRIYRQLDVSKSRKQVAPLLRGFASAGS